MMPQLQTANIYEKLKDTSESVNQTLKVLQMLIKKRQTVLTDIKAKLQTKGITEAMIISFSITKNKINQIVNKLKTEIKHQALFCRIINAKEEIKDINKVICMLI